MKYISKPLEKVQYWILDVIKVLQQHIMSVIFVSVIFVLFWYVPQISDLIVVINQTRLHWLVVFVFFASLSVFAFLISTIGNYFNPPKLEDGEIHITDTITKKPSIFKVPLDAKEVFIEEKRKDIHLLESVEFKETQQQYIKRILPKTLGTVLILSATFAVNHTFYEVYNRNIIFTGDWGFLICIILLFFVLNHKLVQGITAWFNKFKWFNYVPITIAIMALVGILGLGALNHGGAESDIHRLFYALFLLAVFFFLISVSYNEFLLQFKKRVGAPLILALVVGIFLCYIILFFNPQAIKLITPLSIVMICIIGIYTILNCIKLIGFRLNMPLLGITLIMSVIVATYTANNENFTHFEASSTTNIINTPEDRLDLDTYIKQWISDRKLDIEQQKPGEKFPIIFVSAEGGGSRAGLWSFLVQSYLYDQNPDYFKKYLFAMTGASGGGVGNNMFYTQAYELLKNDLASPLKYNTPEADFNYRASTIYSEDYLSTSVASIMGRDLFKSITNLFTFKDRGALLESEWEAQFNTVFNRTDNPLGQAYLNLMPKLGQHPYIRPLLITNTTELQSGERAVITPVTTSKDTNNMDVFTDLLEVYPNDKKMIKRSTAMSMNARFPYISPVASIQKLGQFGDAGYYNNIGGDVTKRLKSAFLKVIEKDSSLVGKYEIKQLLITNFEAETELSYSSQLIAPIVMIANATFAHPKENEKAFTNVYNPESKRTDILQDTTALFSFMTKKANKRKYIKPIIPLGRYLSRAAVRSLEARLVKPEVTRILDSLIPAKDD